MKLQKKELKQLIKYSFFFIILFFVEFQSANKPALYNNSLYFTSKLSQQQKPKPIAIVGDLQRTSIWEIMIGRENNDEERNLLVEQIQKSDPAMLVILGDMVFDGSEEDQWRDFDNLMKPIKNSRIPIYPVLGNHEYWGLNAAAVRYFSSRFVQFSKQHWYTQEYDSLAMIFLDSNESDLTANDWKQQKLWYEKKLREYEADPAIKGVLVFLHHPPYTNSLVTGDELNVQLAFVPAFLKSKKTLAMISGHAHTYERFIKDGKMFIVSGGGGGPRVGLRDGIDFHKDLYTGNSPRPFHFLLLSRDDTGVKVTVRGLLKSTDLFFTMEEYYLPID